MTKTPPKKNPSFGRTVFCGRFFWGREPPKLLEGIGINVMYKARKSWAWPAQRGARFSKNQGFSGKLGEEVDPDFFQQQIRNIQNFKVDLMILSYLIQELLSSLKNRWIDVFFWMFFCLKGKKIKRWVVQVAFSSKDISLKPLLFFNITLQKGSQKSKDVKVESYQLGFFFKMNISPA